MMVMKLESRELTAFGPDAVFLNFARMLTAIKIFFRLESRDFLSDFAEKKFCLRLFEVPDLIDCFRFLGSCPQSRVQQTLVLKKNTELKCWHSLAQKNIMKLCDIARAIRLHNLKIVPF